MKQKLISHFEPYSESWICLWYSRCWHLVINKQTDKQTLTQDEEPDRQVDEDPREPQELHQVVHEQVAFL